MKEEEKNKLISKSYINSKGVLISDIVSCHGVTTERVISVGERKDGTVTFNLNEMIKRSKKP